MGDSPLPKLFDEALRSGKWRNFIRGTMNHKGRTGVLSCTKASERAYGLDQLHRRRAAELLFKSLACIRAGQSLEKERWANAVFEKREDKFRARVARPDPAETTGISTRGVVVIGNL